jgi:hypothetical protein
MMNGIKKIAMAATAAAALAAPLPAAAQSTPQFEYAVKIVCGVISEDVAPLRDGAYFTAVNIHNPGPLSVLFRRKVAVALRVKAGKVTTLKTTGLKPDEAMYVDCSAIVAQLQENQVPNSSLGFVDGFLVIQSQREIDVVAVYTAAPNDTGQVVTYHTERVLPRKM